MAEPQTAQEPTMEEILASIRRIISEDDPPATPAVETASAPAPAPLKADSDDVLELTTRAEPAPFPEAEPPARTESAFARFESGAEEPDEPKNDDSRFDPGSIFDSESDLDLAAPTPAPVPAPEPPPVFRPQPVAAMTDSRPASGLLSESNAANVAGAFSQLSRNVPLPAPGRSLEDVVQEMMRPMLKAWLDQHLPRIVEAKVQAEVERLSRQG